MHNKVKFFSKYEDKKLFEVQFVFEFFEICENSKTMWPTNFTVAVTTKGVRDKIRTLDDTLPRIFGKSKLSQSPSHGT